MNRGMRAAAAVLLACAVAACGPVRSSHMRFAEHGVAPTPDSAVIVFLRPSVYGGGVQSSVYDVSRSGGQQFIGIVSGGAKVAHAVAPGKYLFMVVGENADFMDAEVEAGKTYYVLVAPRMGLFKARFSLLPVHADAKAKYSLNSERFREWLRDTYWVESGPTAQRWYENSRDSIERKRIAYKRKWNGRSAEDKAELYLHADDGI